MASPDTGLDTAILCGTHCVRHVVCHTGVSVIDPNSDLFENLRLELRRGSVIVAVLAQLRAEHYGYALRKALADAGLDIEENTLYPLLRRLESQGLLVSEWREEERRNKRFYHLSPDGERMLERLRQEWQDINTSLTQIL